MYVWGMSMTREDGRRWANQWLAAEQSEREELLDRPLPASESISQALSLIDLACERTGAWPPDEHLTFSELDLAASDRWVELQRRLGAL